MGDRAAPQVPLPQWRRRAADLADHLAQRGLMDDPHLRTALQLVPRHLFALQVFRRVNGADWGVLDGSRPEHVGRWLDLVYADEQLPVQLGPGIGGSSTPAVTRTAPRPGLVARMLQDLDLRTGLRVLEVGTGTGYTTALLCHRVGDPGVFSVDTDEAQLLAAHARLTALGWQPRLACGEPELGWPAQAPFDRVLATNHAGVLPHAWVQQVVHGGLIVADLGTAAHGVLARLAVTDRGDASGVFLGYPALAVRGGNMGRPAELGLRARPADGEFTTAVSPAMLRDQAFGFFCQLHLQGGRCGYSATADGAIATVIGPDGSWAEAILGDDATPATGHLVRHAGPTNLWAVVEAAYQLWCELGHPVPTEFGLRVTHAGQTVWHSQGWSLHTDAGLGDVTLDLLQRVHAGLQML